jgi:hypothetical protein
MAKAPDDRYFDRSLLTRNAQTDAEREQVFNAAVTAWAGRIKGRIVRCEPPGTDHYYALCEYQSGHVKSDCDCDAA